MIALVVWAQLASVDAVAPVRFELPNGLRVWIQEDHARPVALVQVTYKVGSLHEGPGTTGIAHYVEHMVYRATQRIRNEDVYGYIDRIGGRYTGGTWPEFTRYAELVPNWALESALAVTAERMCCALFDSLEFERERSNVVTEANGFAERDAVNAFRDALMSAAFEVHPYRYNSNTWARDNLALSRDEAYAWYKRHYGPNNAVLVVVGDVNAVHARRLVERYFASLPRAPASGEIRLVEPPQKVEKRVTMAYRGSRQQLDILYRAPSASDTEFPALVVVNRLLAARLPKAVRAAGIVDARIVTTDSASPYPLVYRISVESDSTADLERLLRVIDGAVDRLATDGAGDGELQSARQSIAEQPDSDRVQGESSGVPPRRSSLTRIADRLSDREVLAWEVGPELRNRVRAATARITAADAQRYARRWLRRSQRTVGFLVTGSESAYEEERLLVPPLTTPPAKRGRPEPVPASALQPLAPIRLAQTRTILPNGVVVRVAGTRDSAAPHLRIAFAEPADSAGLATAFAADSALRRLRVRVSWSNLSIASRDSARARVLRALGHNAPRAGGSGGNIAAAIAGTGEPAAVFAATTALLGRLPARRAAGAEQTRSGPYDAREERIPLPGSAQVRVVAGVPGVSRDDPDRRALELLNYIVGVPSYGGRLGWALTKSGLTYSSSATTTFGAASGQILFETTCDTRNTDATIQAIREVIGGVGTRGVEGWELREAQAFMLGRTLLYGARDDSNNRTVAGALLDSEIVALDLLDLPALSRAYLSITLDDINRVAHRYYRTNLLKIVAAGALPTAAEPRMFPEGTFRALFEP
jgi:predicted Zn-dependent peptidase